jgi:DNA-binding MarR family transcriptional regulator
MTATLGTWLSALSSTELTMCQRFAEGEVMDDALEGLLWETRRLFRALASAADEALAPLGLTASDRALVEFLARERGPVSLAELARKRSVSRQHIHQSLDRLANPAWVKKTPDPDDARAVRLQLTAEGRALWHAIRRVDRTLLRRLANRVDPASARAASATLRQIRVALEGEQP